MVDLLEITLFAQFIISRASLLSDNARFIQFFLEGGELVRELSVAPVDLWDLGEVSLKSGLRLQFEPLLLERFEGASHTKLDEEVTDEFIALLSSCAIV